MYTSCDHEYLREGVRRGEEGRGGRKEEERVQEEGRQEDEGEVQVRWYTVTADPSYLGVP